MTTDPVRPSPDTDVLIVGAGPVGLALANLLGLRGVSVIVLEQRDTLIDYPRGVGIDDESLRTMQTMGLVEKVLPHTTPDHVMRLVNGRGTVMAEIAPTTREFGWSRRNAFDQPVVDAELLEGLERFPHVEVRFGAAVTRIDDHGDGVTVTIGDGSLTGRYLVGADGGRSATRKHLGVGFEGQSPSTRWLVVDLENDPLGTPNIHLGCDPARPYVSLGLPHAIRRFEFMLFDDESDAEAATAAFVERLLAPHVPDPRGLTFVRRRVYTHHSRIAGSFRRGRVLIAGDAAHLMPVWQGQGYNSGIRDATNLAWKLAAVVGGVSSAALLDSYDAERRAHAKAMIDLSTAFGRIVQPTNRVVAAARDGAAAVLSLSDRATQYVAQMKYKPMPRYTAGVVVDASSIASGRSDARLTRSLHAFRSASSKDSPVGTQFIQPRVRTERGDLLLDDAIGDGWALLMWGADPARALGDRERDVLDRLGARVIAVRPLVQYAAEAPGAGEGVTVVGDVTGALKRWFDTRPTPVVVLRPDRFVAAACLVQETSATLDALARAAHLRPATERVGSGVPGGESRSRR